MTIKPKSELSILLVEDYEMDRTAVQGLLLGAGFDESQIHITTNTLDTQTFLEASSPDILILDLEIPADANTPLRRQDDEIRRSLNFLRKLTEQNQNSQHIIVLSRFPYPWVVYQVLACGVSFIDKYNYKELLIPALEQVQHGHVIISDNVRPYLRQIFSLSLRVGMDKEDVQIIRYIQAGLRDIDIADKMGYTDDWVAKHLTRMFKSYGFHRRDDLANWFRDFVDPVLQFTE